MELIEKQAELSIVANIANHDQRLSSAHRLSVAHENAADDPTFMVLNGLAIQLRLELARRDDRSGERRGNGPSGEQRARDREWQQGEAPLPAQLFARLRIVLAEGKQ